MLTLLTAALVHGCASPGQAQAVEEGRIAGRAPEPTAALPSAAAAGDNAAVARDSAELERLLAAPDGPEAIRLAPRTYAGRFRIGRSVRVTGVPGSVLDGGGRGTVLTIQADNVLIEGVTVQNSGRRHTVEDAGVKATGQHIVFRDLDVRNTLFGVALLQCRACTVERTRVDGAGGDHELRGDGIKLWEAHSSAVRDCRVVNSRDIVVWYTRGARLERNQVHRSRYGTHFMHADGALVRDSTATANVVGVFVMYSKRVRIEGNRLEHASGAAGIGLGFKDSDAVVVEGNRIVGNTTGTYLDNTPRSVRDPVVFRGNAFLGNRAALRLQAPQSGLRFHDNVFLASTALIEVDGGGDAQGVEFLGNYYDDYAGFDLDGNGEGDVAFEVRRVSNDLLESRPELQFFRGSMALSSMDRVAEAVPVFARQMLFSDRRPRTRMPAQLISGSQQP